MTVIKDDPGMVLYDSVIEDLYNLIERMKLAKVNEQMKKKGLLTVDEDE